MQTSHHKKIVLHIDNDEEDRELLREAITKHDGNVMVRDVDNGRDALSYLNKGKLEGCKPSLIVLDLNMPEMDGKQVLCEIRRDNQLADIPVVIFTTSSRLNDMLWAEQQGVAFVTKPLSYPQLTDTVGNMLAYCD